MRGKSVIRFSVTGTCRVFHVPARQTVPEMGCCKMVCQTSTANVVTELYEQANDRISKLLYWGGYVHISATAFSIYLASDRVALVYLCRLPRRNYHAKLTGACWSLMQGRLSLLASCRREGSLFLPPLPQENCCSEVACGRWLNRLDIAKP